MYYKLGQVLQIRAIITTWGITSGDQIFVMYKAYSWKIFEQVVTVAYLTKQLQEVFCRKRFSQEFRKFGRKTPVLESSF